MGSERKSILLHPLCTRLCSVLVDTDREVTERSWHFGLMCFSWCMTGKTLSHDLIIFMGFYLDPPSKTTWCVAKKWNKMSLLYLKKKHTHTTSWNFHWAKTDSSCFGPSTWISRVMDFRHVFHLQLTHLLNYSRNLPFQPRWPSWQVSGLELIFSDTNKMLPHFSCLQHLPVTSAIGWDCQSQMWQDLDICRSITFNIVFFFKHSLFYVNWRQTDLRQWTLWQLTSTEPD